MKVFVDTAEGYVCKDIVVSDVLIEKLKKAYAYTEYIDSEGDLFFDSLDLYEDYLKVTNKLTSGINIKDVGVAEREYRELMEKSRDEIMEIFRNNVNYFGGFQNAFYDVLCRADGDNFSILKDAAIHLIIKYNLNK